MVIITNPSAFVDRVDSAIMQENMKVKQDFVKYYNLDTHTGSTGPFRKPDEFQYQQEFRIVAYPGSPEAISINAASLEDITTPVLTSSDFNTLALAERLA